MPALDRQPLLWAYENDVKVFNYGGTRGWYSDGVFRYKRSWRAQRLPYQRTRQPIYAPIANHAIAAKSPEP